MCALCPALLEEVFEQLGSFSFLYAGDDLCAMVESWVIDDSEERACAATFGVVSTVDESTHAGVHDESRAHRAGLERDRERAVIESPVPDRFARALDREVLSVPPWGAVCLACVPALSEDCAGRGFVDDCANWDFTF